MGVVFDHVCCLFACNDRGRRRVLRGPRQSSRRWMMKGGESNSCVRAGGPSLHSTPSHKKLLASVFNHDAV